MEIQNKKIKHNGDAIRQIRKILGVKQETLAQLLEMTQQNLSLIESKAEIDISTLEKIAKALKVPVDLIKNYEHENVINYIISNNKIENNGYDGLSIGDKTINSSSVELKQVYEALIEAKDKLLAEKDKRIEELENKLREK